MLAEDATDGCQNVWLSQHEQYFCFCDFLARHLRQDVNVQNRLTLLRLKQVVPFGYVDTMWIKYSVVTRCFFEVHLICRQIQIILMLVFLMSISNVRYNNMGIFKCPYCACFTISTCHFTCPMAFTRAPLLFLFLTSPSSCSRIWLQVDGSAA